MADFGWQSTSDDVLRGIDLTGKRALVTGVSAGLGIETARALAAHGAEVIGTARDLQKARAATAAIHQAYGDRFSMVELDLASLASVAAAADALRAAGKPLDLVIANAGVMATPFGRTRDGFETQFGTNHLGHFLLLNRLADLIPSGGRVVCVSSTGHQFADLDLTDPNFERRLYDPISAYGGAKTAVNLFVVEFDRRHKARGVRAAAVHPGGILTELARHMSPELIERMIARVMAETDTSSAERGYKSVAQGAATTLWAGVTAPAEMVGGRYCEDCAVAKVAAKGAGVRPYSVDPQRAALLWEQSEQLVRNAQERNAQERNAQETQIWRPT
jgi:NAD(P)-dependent dehydrogenase (short-subunit alcohol dehydrogenase family)